MGTEQNRQTALKMMASMAEGRLDESLLTDDVVWWVPGKGDVSKADFLKMADAFRGLFSGPMRLDVRGVTADGDRVAVEAESRGPLKNGKTYNNTYHFLFEFRDGKICRSKEYNDTRHVAETLGGPL